MLTHPTIDRRQIVLQRRYAPIRTHLGCRVERHRIVHVLADTASAGPLIEHITLSVPEAPAN